VFRELTMTFGCVYYNDQKLDLFLLTEVPVEVKNPNKMVSLLKNLSPSVVFYIPTEDESRPSFF